MARLIEPRQVVCIRLLTAISEFKFGVPKHAGLEPDYSLAKGNGKSAAKCRLIVEKPRESSFPFALSFLP